MFILLLPWCLCIMAWMSHAHRLPQHMPAAFRRQRCWSYKNIHNTYRTFLIEINQMLQPIIPSACCRRRRRLRWDNCQHSRVKLRSKKERSIYRAALSSKVTGWFNTLRLVCYSPFLHRRHRRQPKAMLKLSVLSLPSDTIFIVQQPSCNDVHGFWVLGF